MQESALLILGKGTFSAAYAADFLSSCRIRGRKYRGTFPDPFYFMNFTDPYLGMASAGYHWHPARTGQQNMEGILNYGKDV